MTSCGIDTKSNVMRPRFFPWIWLIKGNVSSLTIPSSWFKGVPSTTVSWYDLSFGNPRILWFVANFLDMKFLVAPESIIASAVTPANWILIFKWVTPAVVFNAVAFIIRGVLVPASLASNSGSWASFLSCLGPLLVVCYDASGTTVQSITPMGLGRICASLFVVYGVLNTVPLLLS